VKPPKLLSIHYYYPPTGTIGRLRNYYFSLYTAPYFKEIHVVSTKYSTLKAEEILDISHVKMKRVLNFDYRNLSEFLSKFTKKNITNTANAKGNNQGIKIIRQLMDTLPFHFLVGEGGFLYILFGFLSGYKLVKQHEITHLYSSFRPYSDHFIAFLLKICYPKLIWIADFRDLPIDVARDNVLFPALQQNINQRILAKATLVTTVSEGLATHLKKLHHNVYVLRNGIHPQKKEASPIQKNPYFTIAYTGSLYLNQTFEPLLLAIKQLLSEYQIKKNHIQLIYAGKDSAMWQKSINIHELQAIHQDLGLVSLQRANDIQQIANINLLLSWATPELTGTLTGKLYEYMAAGQPILAIVNGIKDEELTHIIHTANGGLVFSTAIDAPDMLLNFIMEKYKNWLNDTPNTVLNDDVLRPFLWETMIKELKKAEKMQMQVV
jgi:hypothetical protein